MTWTLEKRRKIARYLTPCLLVLLVLIGRGLYSNSAGHVFHLDDDHSIRNNPALRSLSAIPSYFTDPKTFSTLLTNVDYRPVLQTSYALNYAAAGYDMPVWHWTQVGIQVWCAFFLYLFALELLKLGGVASRERMVIASLSSLFFMVHPLNSGVVNYISARSSALTAAFLLTAFFLELRGVRWAAVVFMLLALFTKVEAVAALAVFWGISYLRRYRQRQREGVRPEDLLASPREWLPYVGAVVFYLGARQMAMHGIDFAGSAGIPGITRGEYLCIQTTVWWVYVWQWFCPLHLVADNSAYQMVGKPLEPAVMLAQVGWLLVVLALFVAARRFPHFSLLAFSALALLSPTSSIVPLAEMTNEHRPYLPVGLLSIVFVTGLVRLGRALPREAWVLVAALTVAWLGCLSRLTWERNKIFLSAESYWADVVRKAPSARAHNNFGLALLKRGQPDVARHHFEESVRLAPQYSVAHINLALALAREGKVEQAERHYDKAVTFDRGAGEAQMWRGRHFLQQAQELSSTEGGRGGSSTERERGSSTERVQALYEKAKADFEQAATLSNDRYSVAAGLAQAYAGLGDSRRSAEQAIAAGALDYPRLEADIITTAGPYFSSQAQAEKGLLFFAELARQWPTAWWIPANQATLLRKVGQESQARAKDAESAKLRSLQP